MPEYDDNPVVYKQLTAIEEDVVGQINSKQYQKFFPVGRAVALEEDDDQIAKALEHQSSILEQQLNTKYDQHEKLLKQYIENIVANQKEAIEMLRGEVQIVRSIMAKDKKPKA